MFFVLLAIFFAILCVAGGASRADALGQAVVRGAAWGMLITVLLLGERKTLDAARPIHLLLFAAAALPILQLIPLPPELWQSLPGRALIGQAATLSGQPQPWRPLSIVPSATLNAASSLIVPYAVLLLVTQLKPREHQWLLGLALSVIIASTAIGLLQASGGDLNNPFINDTPGVVSGTFANRNHFALFLVFGCLITPIWAFHDGRRPGWRAPAALGLLLLFTLTNLATGSRVALILVAVGLAIGLVLVRREIAKALHDYPRWIVPALIVGVASVIAVFVLISVLQNRAVSIQRVLSLNAEQDLRSQALPTLLAMVREYFPAGAGLGSFDPVYRIHEPFKLLNPQYFNHAHDDFLEVVLDAGLPGLLLMLVGIAWWGAASVRAWRAGSSVRVAFPKLGSSILAVTMIASAFDYPARTPLIMAMMVLAGVWLSDRVVAPQRSFTQR